MWLAARRCTSGLQAWMQVCNCSHLSSLGNESYTETKTIQHALIFLKSCYILCIGLMHRCKGKAQCTEDRAAYSFSEYHSGVQEFPLHYGSN